VASIGLAFGHCAGLHQAQVGNQHDGRRAEGNSREKGLGQPYGAHDTSQDPGDDQKFKKGGAALI